MKEYRTHYGFHEGRDGRVTAPTIMWVKALDLLMEKIRIQGILIFELEICVLFLKVITIDIKISGVDLSNVKALSGAGQQHGSTYWRTGAEDMLKNLRPDKFMHDELAHAFSILDSPIWMDSSTTEQCKNLETAVGGPEELANITGSRAYERFTGKCIYFKLFWIMKADKNECLLKLPAWENNLWDPHL